MAAEVGRVEVAVSWAREAAAKAVTPAREKRENLIIVVVPVQSPLWKFFGKRIQTEQGLLGSWSYLIYTQDLT